MTAVSFILGHFKQTATRDCLHTELKSIIEIILQRIIIAPYNLVPFIKPFAQNLVKLQRYNIFIGTYFIVTKDKIFLTMCSKKKLPGKC